VGSERICLGAIKKLAGLQHEIETGERRDLTMNFFYEGIPDVSNDFIRAAGSYVITESEENGPRVWAFDGALPVEPGSDVANEFITMTDRIFAQDRPQPSFQYPLRFYTDLINRQNQQRAGQRTIRDSPRAPDCNTISTAEASQADQI
jgi:hypothetical protein